MPTESAPTTSGLGLWLPALILAAAATGGALLAQLGPLSAEIALLRWLRDGQCLDMLAGPSWVSSLWLGLTWMGDTGPRIAVTSVTAIALLLARRGHGALFMIAIALSGTVLSSGLKSWIGRLRPSVVPHLDQVSSASFPSGHALASALFYLTLALLLTPLLRQRWARWAAWIAAITLSLAIGASRVALGVHWPTDVIASWVIGGAWLCLCFGLAARHWPKALR